MTIVPSLWYWVIKRSCYLTLQPAHGTSKVTRLQAAMEHEDAVRCSMYHLTYKMGKLF